MEVVECRDSGLFDNALIVIWTECCCYNTLRKVVYIAWCVVLYINVTGAVVVKATAFLTGLEEVDVGDEMVREGLAVYLSETARPHTPNSNSQPSEEDDNSYTEAPRIPVVGDKVMHAITLL